MKGISPFIAVILLIAMTVSVGIIVSIWWTGLIQKQAGIIEEESVTKLKCTHGGILIWDETVKCNFAGATDSLNFTVENTGTIDLYNLKVQIFNGSAIYGPYDVIDILKGSVFTSTFPLKPGWKRSVEVNITPENIAGNAEWINIITQCPDVEDKTYNVACS
ncbi:MAG: hypothetical protein QMD14_05570 [Candidatus Aenigmarchaeota archaeon]|nr:hypothetical protein [Candidatus Aenigmarchaeota archaeon]